MADWRTYRDRVRGQLDEWRDKSEDYVVYQRPPGDPNLRDVYTVDDLIRNITQVWSYPQYVSIIGSEYSVGVPKRAPNQEYGTRDPDHDIYSTNFSLTWKALYHPSTNVTMSQAGRYSFQGLKGVKGNGFHTVTGYINALDADMLLNLELDIVNQYHRAQRHVWIRSLWKPTYLRGADDWKKQNMYLSNHAHGLRLAGNPAGAGDLGRGTPPTPPPRSRSLTPIPTVPLRGGGVYGPPDTGGPSTRTRSRGIREVPPEQPEIKYANIVKLPVVKTELPTSVVPIPRVPMTPTRRRNRWTTIDTTETPFTPKYEKEPYVEEPDEEDYFAQVEQENKPVHALLVTSSGLQKVNFHPPIPVDEEGDVEIVAMETQPIEDTGKINVKEEPPEVKPNIKREPGRPILKQPGKEFTKRVKGMKKVQIGKNEERIFYASPEELKQQFGREHVIYKKVQPARRFGRQIDPLEFLDRIPSVVQGPADLYPPQNPEDFSVEELQRQAKNAAVAYQLSGGQGPPPKTYEVVDLTEMREQPPLPIQRETQPQQETQPPAQPLQGLVIQPNADEGARFVTNEALFDKPLTHKRSLDQLQPLSQPLSHAGPESVPTPLNVGGGKKYGVDSKELTQEFLDEIDELLKDYEDPDEIDNRDKQEQAVKAQIQALHEMGIEGVEAEDLNPTVTAPIIPGGTYLVPEKLTPTQQRYIDVLETIGNAYMALANTELDGEKARDARKLGHTYLKSSEQQLEEWQRAKELDIIYNKDETLRAIASYKKILTVVNNKLTAAFGRRASSVGDVQYPNVKSQRHPEEPLSRRPRTYHQKVELLEENLDIQEAKDNNDPVAMTEAIIRKTETIRKPDLVHLARTPGTLEPPRFRRSKSLEYEPPPLSHYPRERSP